MNNTVFNHSKSGYGSSGEQSPIKFARLNATSDGDNTVIAAVTGKKLRILSINAAAVGAGIVSFKSGASTTLFTYSYSAQGQTFFHCSPYWICETAAGEAFVVNTQASQDLLGAISYVEITP